MGPPQLFRPELPPAPPIPAAVVVGPLQGPGQLVAQVQHRQVLRAAVVRGAEGQVEEAGQVQHPPPHGAAVGGGGTSRAAQSRVEVPDGEAGEAQPQAPAGPSREEGRVREEELHPLHVPPELGWAPVAPAAFADLPELVQPPRHLLRRPRKGLPLQQATAAPAQEPEPGLGLLLPGPVRLAGRKVRPQHLLPLADGSAGVDGHDLPREHPYRVRVAGVIDHCGQGVQAQDAPVGTPVVAAAATAAAAAAAASGPFPLDPVVAVVVRAEGVAPDDTQEAVPAGPRIRIRILSRVGPAQEHVQEAFVLGASSSSSSSALLVGRRQREEAGCGPGPGPDPWPWVRRRHCAGAPPHGLEQGCLGDLLRGPPPPAPLPQPPDLGHVCRGGGSDHHEALALGDGAGGDQAPPVDDGGSAGGGATGHADWTDVGEGRLEAGRGRPRIGGRRPEQERGEVERVGAARHGRAAAVGHVTFDMHAPTSMTMHVSIASMATQRARTKYWKCIPE